MVAGRPDTIAVKVHVEERTKMKKKIWEFQLRLEIAKSVRGGVQVVEQQSKIDASNSEMETAKCAIDDLKFALSWRRENRSSRNRACKSVAGCAETRGWNVANSLREECSANVHQLPRRDGYENEELYVAIGSEVTRVNKALSYSGEIL